MLPSQGPARRRWSPTPSARAMVLASGAVNSLPVRPPTSLIHPSIYPFMHPSFNVSLVNIRSTQSLTSSAEFREIKPDRIRSRLFQIVGALFNVCVALREEHWVAIFGKGLLSHRLLGQPMQRISVETEWGCPTRRLLKKLRRIVWPKWSASDIEVHLTRISTRKCNVWCALIWNDHSLHRRQS